MSTIRQKRLAKAIVKSLAKGEELTKKELLVSAGYSVVTGEASPERVIAQKGVQEELKALGFNDERLARKHDQLLNQQELSYFVFPRNMEDEEIVDHVESATGLRVINIRVSDKGKMAFYAKDDAQTQGKALDMAYKLIGKYAPDKHVNVNVDVEADEVIKRLTDELNALYGGTGIPSDGAAARAVGTEAQD